MGRGYERPITTGIYRRCDVNMLWLVLQESKFHTALRERIWDSLAITRGICFVPFA